MSREQFRQICFIAGLNAAFYLLIVKAWRDGFSFACDKMYQRAKHDHSKILRDGNIIHYKFSTLSNIASEKPDSEE